MIAFRVSYTLENEYKGEILRRRIRQTFVNPKVAAAYYTSVANFGAKMKAVTVSNFKLNPSHALTHTVHV